jgi:polysaccharide biosynthesis protein PslH
MENAGGFSSFHLSEEHLPHYIKEMRRRTLRSLEGYPITMAHWLQVPEEIQAPQRDGAKERPPRVLFLCQALPYPPDGGVHIRAFHLLRILSKRYRVTALCFYRKAARESEKEVQLALEGLRAQAGVDSAEAFPIPQEHSRLRLLWDHGRSVLTRRAYTVFAYESAEVRDRIEGILSEEKYDLIHIDSLDLSWYLSRLPPLPVVCDHHNVESVLLDRRSRQEAGYFMRRYIAHQARLTRREEERWCGAVNLNLTVSAQDRELLLERAPGASVVVVPNGVDTSAFEPAYAGEDGIVFVGGYTWFPNKDGMEYFCDRILPLIRDRAPDTHVVWVGRAPRKVVEEYRTRHGVEMTGYVDDIRPYVASASCVVVPLRVGGGTRLKILDAWAMGKAVVSTSPGCEGLDARDGDNILIRDSEQAFAEAVHAVMVEPELRGRLGRAARKTAEETYDWEQIGDRMLEVYGRVSRRD